MNSFVLSTSEFFHCLHLENTKKGMKFVPFRGRGIDGIMSFYVVLFNCSSLSKVILNHTLLNKMFLRFSSVKLL